MAKRLEIIKNNWDGGLQEFTSPLLLADNEAPFLRNVETRKPGILAKSLGFVEMGTSTGTDAVRYLGVHRTTAGVNTRLRVTNTNLDTYNGTAWANNSTGFAAGSAVLDGVNAYVDEQDRLYITQGIGANLAFFNGTTTSFITDVRAKFAEFYKNRLYLGFFNDGTDSYPSRVQYSEVGQDTFNVDYDFFEDAGRPITALKAYADFLMVFTEESLFLYDGYSLRAVPGNLGTVDFRSVQIVEGGVMWYNRAGVYYFRGGVPQLVSRPIQNLLDLVGGSVAAGADPYGRYVLNIGTITYAGTEYTGVELIYDPLSNQWLLRDGRSFRVYATELADGVNTLLAGGSTNSKVYQVDVGQSLAGSAIASEYFTNVMGLESPEAVKNGYFLDVTYKPQNVSEFIQVQYRLDGAASWNNIEGSADNIALTGTGLIATKRLRFPRGTQFKTMQLRIAHSSSAAAFNIYEVRVTYDITPQK